MVLFICQSKAEHFLLPTVQGLPAAGTGAVWALRSQFCPPTQRRGLLRWGGQLLLQNLIKYWAPGHPTAPTAPNHCTVYVLKCRFASCETLGCRCRGALDSIDRPKNWTSRCSTGGTTRGSTGAAYVHRAAHRFSNVGLTDLCTEHLPNSLRSGGGGGLESAWNLWSPGCRMGGEQVPIGCRFGCPPHLRFHLRFRR